MERLPLLSCAMKREPPETNQRWKESFSRLGHLTICVCECVCVCVCVSVGVHTGAYIHVCEFEYGVCVCVCVYMPALLPHTRVQRVK